MHQEVEELLDENVQQKFWAHVNLHPENSENKTDNSCWEWQGFYDKRNHTIRFFLPSRTSIIAHRYAYFLKHGILPDKMIVWRTCLNVLCVNPDHFTLLTRAECSKYKNNINSPFKRGEQHVMAKLSEEDVLVIKAHLREGASYLSLAKDFDVSHVSIHNIAKGKTWKHVREELEPDISE